MDADRLFEGIVQKKLDEVANDIFQELIAEVPVHTGRTKQSIRVYKTGKYKRAIGSYLLSAKYADEGNGPGRIYPVHSKYLRFIGYDGKVHYAKSVRSYIGSHYVEDVANRHR